MSQSNALHTKLAVKEEQHSPWTTSQGPPTEELLLMLQPTPSYSHYSHQSRAHQWNGPIMETLTGGS